MKKWINWSNLAIGLSGALFCYFLVRETEPLVEAHRERPALLQRVQELERERDSLSDENFSLQVELGRMDLTLEEKLDSNERKEFYEWLYHNTE